MKRGKSSSHQDPSEGEDQDPFEDYEPNPFKDYGLEHAKGNELALFKTITLQYVATGDAKCLVRKYHEHGSEVATLFLSTFTGFSDGRY